MQHEYLSLWINSHLYVINAQLTTQRKYTEQVKSTLNIATVTEIDTKCKLINQKLHQLFVSDADAETGGKNSKQRCPSWLMLFCTTARMTFV